MKPRSILAAACFVYALGAGTAAAQGTVKVGVIAEFSGPVRRLWRADRGRHEGVHEAARRHGRRQEDRAHHADTKGPAPEVAKRLAQELVTRDKVRLPRRLRPDAERDGGRAGRDRGEGADGHHERGDVVITTKSPYIVRVSMTLPQVTQPIGAMGGEERHQARSTRWSPTTAPASTPRRVHQDVQGRRRRDRRHGAHAAAESRFRAVHPARQGRQARGGVRVPAGRRAGHRVHEGLQRARARRRPASS